MNLPSFSNTQRSLTSPMGIIGTIKPTCLRINSTPFLGTLLIALGFILLGGNFIMAPGITLALPTLGTKPIPGVPIASVLTIGQNGTCFFEGQVLSLKETQAIFEKNSHHLVNQTLLVKGDRGTPMETLLQVCEWARSHGFSQIQIAAIPNKKTSFIDWAKP